MKLHGRHALTPSRRFKRVRRVRDINKYHPAKIDLSLRSCQQRTRCRVASRCISSRCVASRRVCTRHSHGSALLYGVCGCTRVCTWAALYARYRRIPAIDAIPEAGSEFETNRNFGAPGNWLRRIFWLAKWDRVACVPPGYAFESLYTREVMSGFARRLCECQLHELQAPNPRVYLLQLKAAAGWQC